MCYEPGGIWNKFFGDAIRTTASSTVMLAVATFFLWHATNRAISESRIASEREARPYVQVNKVNFIGDANKEISIKGSAEIVNSGKTPAINIHVCGDIVLLENGETMTDDLPCPHPKNLKKDHLIASVFSLGSGAPPQIINSPKTTIRATNTTIESVIEALKLGMIELYFYGNIEYGDIINTETIHHTTFCGKYNAESNTLDVCEKHNQMN